MTTLPPDTAAGPVPPSEGTAIDPRRLLVFREVGRRGSLAAAARALGWTQPAVSQHVRRLERDLGLPLITRVGRGIALTEPGRLLLRHADGVAATLAAAEHAMADLAGLRTGRVRLAAFPSASATFVSAALARLAERHPGLDVRLTELEPPEAVALLRGGDCDVAIVFDYPDVDPGEDLSGLVRVRLLEDPVRLVLPAGHPRAGDTSVALGELAGERWIAGCLRCRQHLLASAAREGFTPDIPHSTDDYVVVQALVAAGLAVAALPGLALAAATRPDVAVTQITGASRRSVTALVTPEARTIPAVAATLDALRSRAPPAAP